MGVRGEGGQFDQLFGQLFDQLFNSYLTSCCCTLCSGTALIQLFSCFAVLAVLPSLMVLNSHALTTLQLEEPACSRHLTQILNPKPETRSRGT